jgi:hypothetical protein
MNYSIFSLARNARSHPGRNTTIVRSNYHLDPDAHFCEFSLTLCRSTAPCGYDVLPARFF